jgi:ABC-type phosphate transport system substrate-binding protein
MKHFLSPRVAAPLMAAAALTAAGSALADPDCNTLPGSTYITGSSAVKPFMAGLGKALSGTTTLIYKGQGSCVGVDAVISSTKITGTASYWDVTGTEKTCNLDPAGVVADVGVSDVFATSCPGVASLPAGVGDFFGPNQVMELVVPTASSQASISAEAAYFVFGFGKAGMVTPWIDESQLFVRSPTSGTQQMLARAFNVPADKWKGMSLAKSGDVLTAVASSVSPEAAIGILSADVADANRDKVKTLAFEAFKQKTCGFWPDSTATSFDKRNVRDGHYPVWGPLHFFANVGANNVPTKPDAANLIGYFTGKAPVPAGVNLLDLEVSAHTVPSCAMKVQRSTELGDVSPFTPADPCGCYFESKLNGSPAMGCTACTKDAECGGSATHCRHGYCEAN